MTNLSSTDITFPIIRIKWVGWWVSVRLYSTWFHYCSYSCSFQIKTTHLCWTLLFSLICFITHDRPVEVSSTNLISFHVVVLFCLLCHLEMNGASVGVVYCLSMASKQVEACNLIGYAATLLMLNMKGLPCIDGSLYSCVKWILSHPRIFLGFPRVLQDTKDGVYSRSHSLT